MIKTKDTYVSKLCIFFTFYIFWIFLNVFRSFFDWWKHINMDVTLPFWVITRSGRRNVMNHIWSFFRRGCGDLFYHESYCDEGVIMTIYGFLNIQMFCDVSSGVGLCPYMGNWCVYTLIWFPPSLLVFLGWIKCPNIYY